MELKLCLITFLVLFTTFRIIETKRFGGGSSSSRRTSSSYHRTPSHHTSSYKSRSKPGPSNNRNPHRPFGTVPPPKNSGTGGNRSPFRPFPTIPSPRRPATSSILHSERVHSSTTGHHPSNSKSDPYRDASAPPLNSGSSNNRNPHRPFGTVPPPKNSGTGGNRSPFRPFSTIPPPRHTDFPKPVTPRPIGFVTPGQSGTLPKPTVSHPPITQTGNQPSTNSHRRPVTHHGHGNTSISNRPPSTPGRYNSSGQGLMNPGHGSWNNSGGRYDPVTPTKSYPTQGHSGGAAHPQPPYYIPSHPTQGHPGGAIYPHQQPIYNPAYPGNYHQSAPVYIPSNPNHIYPQNGPSLAPNPGHTIVVVPGQTDSGYYSRSTGDIFKEALIHAGVNAAVHRLTSPSHHYDHYNHNSWNSYGTPPQGSSVTSTNTHIVNNNYYGQPPGPSPNNANGGSNPPSYNPTQNYPSGGAQGGLSPPGVVYPNVNNGNSGSQGSSSSPANPLNPQFPSNGQSQPSQNGGQQPPRTEYNWMGGISDEELRNITEKLFSMDETVYKFISINLQNQTAQNNTNVTDASPQPLFSIHPDAYKVPTIQAIRTLYEVNSAIENKTRESSRKEEALLVDILLNTNVMTTTMHFLTQKNLIEKDYFKQKDFLKRIWFTPYDGSSSGFKRVFQGEVVGGEILYGIQDWITFDFHEKSKHANYWSYIEKIPLGQNATILKINFEMSGIKKLGTSIFVGTSPELEMALYTICHYARPNNYCVVSLGGTQFTLYTHKFRYFGNDLIDLAFPLV